MAATPHTPSRGGYRGTSSVARFTEQLVWLDTPATKDRVVAIAEPYGIAQSKVLRACAQAALADLEAGLADGSIKADSLV